MWCGWEEELCDEIAIAHWGDHWFISTLCDPVAACDKARVSLVLPLECRFDSGTLIERETVVRIALQGCLDGDREDGVCRVPLRP